MTFQQTAELTKHLITLLKIDESSKEGLLNGVMSLELDFGLEQISSQQLRKLLQSCESELEKRGNEMKLILQQRDELVDALLAVKRHGLIEKEGYETIVGIVSEAITKTQKL